MSYNPGSLRDYLVANNEEYRRLEAQHREYESRLMTLLDKVVLSDDEQVEEVTLKKKKLHVKDQMEALVRQVRQGPMHT
jgi:uncharacterized protein